MILTTGAMKRNSRPLSVLEREWLINIINGYSCSPKGEWINEVPYNTECKYYWCDAMNMDNCILGARPLFGKDIYLAPPPNGSDKEFVVKDWIMSIASVAIHELRHMWQQKEFGLLTWSVLRFPEVLPPLYGKVIIERDGFQIEREAEEYIASLATNNI